MKRWLAFLFILSLCSGCYKTVFYTDTDQLRISHDGETSHTSTAFSLIELDPPTELRPLCPSGISKLTMEQTWTDGLLHYFTLGNYSPQTTKVWCKRRTR